MRDAPAQARDAPPPANAIRDGNAQVRRSASDVIRSPVPMQGYPTIVRTGSHELDVQTVEQHRRAAAAQGVVLFVQPLPGGGFQLSAAGAPADGVGATMPSNQQRRRPLRPSAQPAARDAAAERGARGSERHAPVAFWWPPKSARPRRRRSRSSSARAKAIARRAAASARFATRRSCRTSASIVLRFPRTISGDLCKHCIDKYFFRFTGVTMLLGWWGVISFFYSCFAVPANFINWTGSFGMRAPPDDVDSLRERRARGAVGIAVGRPLRRVRAAHVRPRRAPREHG